jgi:hypothetical protein
VDGVMALLLVAAMGLFGWALTQGKLPTLYDPNNVEQADTQAGTSNHVQDKNKDDD